MRRILAIILLGLPPLLLIRWDSRHGNAVPNWLMLAVCAPLVIAVMAAKFSEEDAASDAGRAMGNWLLFLMGLFAMGVGMVSFALRHESTWLGLFGVFGWALPMGALMAVAAVVRALRA